MMPTTTLNEIKRHNPCESGWKKLTKNLGGIRKYGKDTPVTLLQILDSNGLNDALWALRACNDERFARLLACDYAEHILHIFESRYPDDKRPRRAIEVSRRCADGLATEDELNAARDAARAARDAAWAAEAAARAAWAAWAAARAAEAAARAARDAARAAERQWQEEHLRQLLMKEGK